MQIENIHSITGILKQLIYINSESQISFTIDCQAQSAVSVKDEPCAKVGSDHGEEEMEVDSADEQDENAKNQSQISKSRSVATFNTLSSLSSLRPGILSQTFTSCRICQFRLLEPIIKHSP